MTQHNGLLSSTPASRIPAEVWMEIFTFALPRPLAVSSFERALYRRSEAPWNVSHVCLFWRRTASYCSRLWSHDTIHTLTLKDPVSLARTRLERVRFRGCHFTFQLGLSAFRGRNGSLAQTLFQVLIDYSTCWESITLTVLPVCVDFINIPRGKFPTIRSLNLTYYPKSHFTGFEVCPLLQCLVLAGPEAFETQSYFPWAQLRKFVDKRSQASADEDATARYYQKILTSSPDLREFQVTNIMIPALLRPIAHQKLSYLSICNAEFLRGLSLPALQNLIIGSTIYDSAPQPEDLSAILLAFFAASGGCSRLEYLLVTDAFTDVELLHVFLAVPGLKRLSMRYEQWDEGTVELMPFFISALLTFDDTDPSWEELDLDALLALDNNSVNFHVLPVLESFEMQFKWHLGMPDSGIDSLVGGADLVQMLCMRYVLPEHPSLRDAYFVFSGKEVEQPPEEVVGMYRDLKKHGLNVNVEIHTRRLPTDDMEMRSLLSEEEEEDEDEADE